MTASPAANSEVAAWVGVVNSFVSSLREFLVSTQPGILNNGKAKLQRVTGGSVGILCGGMASPSWYLRHTCTAPIPISGISGMKAERFTAGSLWIERTRHREGPPVVYTVMIKESSRAFTDHKAILKFVKWPKGTPTGDALRRMACVV